MNTEVDYAVNFLVSTIKEKLSSMSETTSTNASYETSRAVA